jgi:lysozyme family protein
MSPEFDYAFKYLLVDEGLKYTDDPDDSGGPTKFGITQDALSGYMGSTASIQDVQALTLFKAQVFYWEMYWRKLCCNHMTNVGAAVAIFDTGVLFGAGTSALMAQKAISLLTGATLKLDGIIGDNTVSPLNLASESSFLDYFQKQVLARIDHVITANPKNEKYRAGWTNRANRLLTLVNAHNEIESEPKT